MPWGVGVQATRIGGDVKRSAESLFKNQAGRLSFEVAQSSGSLNFVLGRGNFAGFWYTNFIDCGGFLAHACACREPFWGTSQIRSLTHIHTRNSSNSSFPYLSTMSMARCRGALGFRSKRHPSHIAPAPIAPCVPPVVDYYAARLERCRS